MARKAKKYHFIYKTTNLLNGRYYIGMHSTDSLADGYMGSGKRLRRSLNKYGKENHKVEILEFFDSREELKKREKEIVTFNEIAKEDCMNLTVGGEGGFISLDGVKLGRVKADFVLKEKYGDNFRKIISTNYHKLMSEKDKLDWISKIKKGQKDYNHITFLNKKHSKKTKIKMSDSKKGTGIGEKNSQYGTCWVTNGTQNKKIKKEQLEIFILQGWNKGRIKNAGNA